MTNKASIYLNEIELEALNKHLPDISYLRVGCNHLTEKQLSYILYWLPTHHFLRDYLQKAGRNIFKWKK